MSYILDALRKADAERGRGAVPDLHAQPVLRASASSTPATRALPWAGIAAGAAVVAMSALAWALLARDAPLQTIAPITPITPAAQVELVAPATPAPGIAAVPSAGTAPAPLSQAPPIAAAPVVTAPIAPAQVAPARPPAANRPVPEARPVARQPVAAPASAAAPTPPVKREPAPGPAEPRVYAPGELPDEIRRELPALAIGGAMYSDNPANRMLIINGQVFHERDKLAPNLTLVQIKLKAAVLEYRGYRYGISY